MTGVELEKYLMSSNIFKDENVYMVETIDNKIFNTHNKELALLNIQKIVFELCNSKDKIQFHPEFSTPPPKYNAC